MSLPLLNVKSLLSPEDRAHLDTLGPKYAQFRGFTMEDDGDDGGDDGDDDDAIELDVDTVIKVGGKSMTVGQLQGIATREKRQGKKAGATGLLKRLGFDTEEDAKAALARVPKDDQGTGQGGNGGTDDEAARRARQREEEAARKEAAADAKTRRLDLRGALRDHGVSRADLDYGLALLDPKVDDGYDDDDLEAAVAELRTTRVGKALFEDDTDDGGDPRQGAPRQRPAADIPQGRARRKNQPTRPQPGEEGRRRAAQRGFIKVDDRN